MTDLVAACFKEVSELHGFFVAWMTAAVPRTEPVFSRVSTVLADDFLIVNPRGILTEQALLVVELEAAHGGRPGFEIWIEDYQFRRAAGALSLVTYQEWQRLSGATTARLSTALFRRRPGLPNGVEWLHVHETWLPDREG